MFLKGLLASCLFGLATLAPLSSAELPKANEFAESKTICRETAKLEGISNPVDNIYKLKDLSKNTFYTQVGEKDGFMVYDPVVKSFIEKSRKLVSPYNFSEAHDYYYFGPMNYYERIDDKFYSLTDKKFIDLDYAYSLQKIFDSQLKTFREAQSKEAYKAYLGKRANSKVRYSVVVGDKTYINNYKIIRDCKHPSNYDGSCGYVAATIILYFRKKTANDRLIGSQYLDANGELNDTGATKDVEHNLKDKLVDLAGGNPASWGKSVRDAMFDYSSEVNVSASATYYFLKIGLEDELIADRPAIIFGALPQKNGNSGLGNHAVVAYGVEKTWWGGYYIVNYGYDSDTAEVDLGFGFVGSVCLFKLL